MLAAQRQHRIIEEIQRAGAVRVGDLTRLLGVSDMTIRRDLDALSRRGLLRKVHGGATIREAGSVDEPGFQAKVGRERDAKEAIARAAASLVNPGSAIAVTAGTTTYALAVHLTHIPDLTVVTNSPHVADILHQNGDHARQTVVLTGGVRTPSDALVGPVAVQAIRSLHVDCVFMGVHGIDPIAGYTSPNLMEAETNRAMVASARRLVVLADHTKWGVVGLSAIAGLGDAAVLVTDTGISPDARELLRESVGELIVADADDNSARPPDTDLDTEEPAGRRQQPQPDTRTATGGERAGGAA
jgi:DeoR/GlpR family transcriptional regulator of sugar metabolism